MKKAKFKMTIFQLMTIEVHKNDKLMILGLVIRNTMKKLL